MKIPLFAAAGLLCVGTALAQSGPPPESMRAEHQRYEAEWADCKAIADGTARATCYEKVHDEQEAAMAARQAERHGHGGSPPQ
jgi:hypothetical protein